MSCFAFTKAFIRTCRYEKFLLLNEYGFIKEKSGIRDPVDSILLSVWVGWWNCTDKTSLLFIIE